MDKKKTELYCQLAFWLTLIATIISTSPWSSIWWGIGMGVLGIQMRVCDQRNDAETIAVFIGCTIIVIGAAVSLLVPEFFPEVLSILDIFGTVLVMAAFAKAIWSDIKKALR